MKRISSWCLSVAAVLLFAGLPAQAQDAKKADPVGTWTWTMQGRGGGGGGEAREVTMKITKEGDKLAGTMSGRQNETKLQNVKMEGDELSFDYTRETQNGSFTQKYKGKVAGDTITGKITSERDGQSRERDWAAKRKTDAKKDEKKEEKKSAS
jgi:hypothetical protein